VIGASWQVWSDLFCNRFVILLVRSRCLLISRRSRFGVRWSATGRIRRGELDTAFGTRALSARTCARNDVRARRSLMAIRAGNVSA